MFRLGLVGAGRMGRVHLRALSASNAVCIAAVADPSDMAGDVGVARYRDWAEMLDAGGLDGVLIAAPSPLHLALIEQIAAAGLPILCEKPCGITAEQARGAAAAARRHGVRLQVAYW